MKSSISTWAGILIGCAALAACTTPRNPNELAQNSVRYVCSGPNGQHPLTVQYTFQGEEPLSARISDQVQSVSLNRVTNTSGMVGNTFTGNGYTWTTASFGPDSLDEAEGKMLTRDVQQQVNGQTQTINTILAQDCKVVD